MQEVFAPSERIWDAALSASAASTWKARSQVVTSSSSVVDTL